MYFLKNKTFTIFLLILAIAAGLYSLSSIPKEFYPEISVPIVVVSTPYPGASPTEVEESITDTLEEALVGNIDSLDEVTSRSQGGISVISLQFLDSADIAQALLDVKDAVDQKKGDLPADAEEPIVSKVSFSDQPIFTFALSSSAAKTALRAQAEELEDLLLSISGVSEVAISGVSDREISVVLDPAKLSLYGLSPLDVSGAISGAKRVFPAGSAVIAERTYRLDLTSDIENVKDLESVILKSSEDGSYVFVRDVVSSIEDGLAKDTTLSRIANPKTALPQQAIIFNIRKQEGGDVLQLTDAVKLKLDTYTKETPGANLVTIFDAGKEIRINLSDLTSSGLQTILLILVIMGLMVGFRESIIASLAVPLSFLLTFIGMQITGQTINFITLFSLILVIGILIDSTIVIVEGIYDFTQEGYSLSVAAEKTLQEFSKPVIAGVLTTIAIFFPLMTLSGTLGQFIGGIPRVINIVLVMSVIVALIFIPIIAMIVYKLPIKEPVKLIQGREKLFANLAQKYENFLRPFLANSRAKKRFMYGLIALFISSFMLVGSGLIRGEFFPPDELDRAYINIELTEGSTLAQSSEAAKELEAIIQTQDNVDSFTTTIGTENIFVGGGRQADHFASITVNVDSRKNGEHVSSAIREAAKSIDDFKVLVLVPESGPPVGAPFQVNVTGSNWSDINTLSEKLAGIISELPQSRDVASGISTGVTDLTLSIQRDRLAQYGLTAANLSGVVRASIFGTTATSIKSGNDDEIDVVVKVAVNQNATDHTKTNHLTFDDIRNLGVQTSQGEVPLGYFLKESLSQSKTSARHKDGLKTNTIAAYISDGFLPNDLVAAFGAETKELELPSDVSFSLAGASDESDQASTELLASLVLGLFLIFAVLIWQFGSIRDTLFIVSVIPLGLIGVLYGLFIFNMTLSFTAMLGFIALVGIVVNDSIILVDVMNKTRLRNPGLSKVEVVVRGATARLRPVLLTTITTVLGMIPLLFVSPLWKPFAFALIFGLSFATLLTLIVIPIIYAKWSK